MSHESNFRLCGAMAAPSYVLVLFCTFLRLCARAFLHVGHGAMQGSPASMLAGAIPRQQLIRAGRDVRNLMLWKKKMNFHIVYGVFVVLDCHEMMLDDTPWHRRMY